MKPNTAYRIIIAILIAALFFLSGYNNKRIKQETERIDQLETHHIVK